MLGLDQFVTERAASTTAAPWDSPLLVSTTILIPHYDCVGAGRLQCLYLGLEGEETTRRCMSPWLRNYKKIKEFKSERHMEERPPTNVSTEDERKLLPFFRPYPGEEETNGEHSNTTAAGAETHTLHQSLVILTLFLTDVGFY